MEPIIDTYNKLTFFISEEKRKGRYEKKLMEAKRPKHPGRREGEPRIQISQYKQPQSDGDKNVKNLNIQPLKTGLLHNLHVRFSCL